MSARGHAIGGQPTSAQGVSEQRRGKGVLLSLCEIFGSLHDVFQAGVIFI